MSWGLLGLYVLYIFSLGDQRSPESINVSSDSDEGRTTFWRSELGFITYVSPLMWLIVFHLLVRSHVKTCVVYFAQQHENYLIFYLVLLFHLFVIIRWFWLWYTFQYISFIPFTYISYISIFYCHHCYFLLDSILSTFLLLFKLFQLFYHFIATGGHSSLYQFWISWYHYFSVTCKALLVSLWSI